MKAPAPVPRARVALLAAAVALQLGACAQRPFGSDPDGVVARQDAAWPEALRSAVVEFARRQRQSAEAAERDGAWADAARCWEVVALLSPHDVDAAAQWARLRQRIDEGVRERLHRAAELRRRGDLDGAQRLGLQALALRPDDEDAADLVRALETERNRRTALAHRPLPAPSALAGAGVPGGRLEDRPQGRASAAPWATRPAR